MLTWIDTLVSQVPEGWECELDPRNDGDRLLEVPEDLLKAYRAAMWAMEQANSINAEHQRSHDDATFDGTEIDTDACAAAKEGFNLHKTRASILQEAIRQEIRHRLGLTQSDRIMLTQEGMVIVAPDPLDSLMDALGGSISVLRI